VSWSRWGFTSCLVRRSVGSTFWSSDRGREEQILFEVGGSFSA